MQATALQQPIPITKGRGMEQQQENFTQTPNSFFDALLAKITSLCELKVTLALIRKTSGYHKDSDVVSISQLETLTGLYHQGVVDGINLGLKRGTIKRHKAGQSWEYSLNLHLQVIPSEDYSSPDKDIASPPTRPEVVLSGDGKVVPSEDTQKKLEINLNKEIHELAKANSPTSGVEAENDQNNPELPVTPDSIKGQTRSDIPPQPTLPGIPEAGLTKKGKPKKQPVTINYDLPTRERYRRAYEDTKLKITDKREIRRVLAEFWKESTYHPIKNDYELMNKFHEAAGGKPEDWEKVFQGMLDMTYKEIKTDSIAYLMGILKNGTKPTGQSGQYQRRGSNFSTNGTVTPATKQRTDTVQPEIDAEYLRLARADKAAKAAEFRARAIPTTT